MKRKGLKRALSFMLAVAMILSLVPAMAAEGRQKIVIDMSGNGMSYKDNTAFVVNGAVNSAANLVITNNAYSIVPEKTTDYQMRRTSIVDGIYINQLQLRAGAKVIWPTGNGEYYDRMSMLTIKTNIAEAGYYSVTMQGYKWYAASTFGIYINGTYAGDYCCYTSDKASGITLADAKTLNTIYIPSGDVEISFRPRIAYYNTPNLLPYKLTLTPVDVGQLEYKSVKHNMPQKVIVGEYADITASIEMNDGSIRSFGLANDGTADINNTVSVAVESDTVASVSNVSVIKPEKGDIISFRVNGVSLGTTNVIISGKIDGVEYSKSIPVEVAEKPKLSNVKVVFDKESVPATRTAKASLELIRSDDKAYTENYSVEYSSSDDSVAAIDENGAITTFKEGVATITAKVTTPDGVVEGSAVLTVAAPPVLGTLKLSSDSEVLVVGIEQKVTASATMNDGIAGDINDYELTYSSSDEAVASVSNDGIITPYTAGTVTITATAQNEIGEQITGELCFETVSEIPTVLIDFKKMTMKSDYKTPDITPGIKITYPAAKYFRKYTYADSGKSIVHVKSNTTPWPKGTNNVHTFGFTTELPYESDYSIFISGGKWYAGGYYSVFVDGKYIGDKSFWDGYTRGTTFATGPNEQFNTVHLGAGEHEILFRLRGSGYATPYLLLDTMSFIPVNGETELSEIVTDVPDQLAIGEIYEASGSAVMSDNSAYHFGVTAEGAIDEANTFVAETSGDALSFEDFSAYEVGASGKASFTLTGIKEGISTITFSATVDGKTVTKEKSVTVSDDPISSAAAGVAGKELFIGDVTALVPVIKLESGRIINSPAVSVSYESLTENIATVSGTTITALAEGTARIRVTASFNGKTVEGISEIRVLNEGMTEIKVTAGGSDKIRYTDDANASPEDYTVPLYVQAISNLGNEIDMTGAEISAVALTPEYAKLDENLNIVPVYVDPEKGSEASFEVTVKTADSRELTVTASLPIINAKTEATYMTAEKQEAARANYKKFTWTKTSVDNTYIQYADEFVGKLDLLYDMITSNGVPRSLSVGAESDPEMYYCRYCACNIQIKYGNYGWLHNPFSNPWKVQCPDCKRLFPTNDFESFYKLGLNEYGEFDRQRALDAHAELFGDPTAEPGSDAYYGYGVKGGYLYNELYDNLETVKELNVNKGLREGESTATWGVDDGYGYVPKKPDGTPYKYEESGVVERHTYIAEYMHSGIWRKSNNAGVVYEAIGCCAYAYLYTGEARYGRVAAILLDRVADFYPDYDISVYGNDVWNSDGGSNLGKAIGRIWETGNLSTMSTAYDIVYDLYDDPYVLKYIADKANVWKMHYAKKTANQIRTNIEDGIIRVGLDGLVDTSISGNFGYPQKSNAICAVVLDSKPETGEWLDYLMAAGWTSKKPCLGGGINEQLIDSVDADGQGDEGSSYNVAWLTSLISINEALNGYENYAEADFYNNPKFVQMFYANIPLMSTYFTPNIGDSKATASKGQWMTKAIAMEAWENIGDPVFAQILYLLNGNSANGLRYGMLKSDPERLAKEVQEVIDEYGVFEPDSEMMTNFGYAILRDGGDYTNGVSQTAKDTRRNVWMYFGTNDGHAHKDTLNLGMTAFGLNYMPDLGYPESTSTQPNRLQWVSTTLSHNTVMVDKKQQTIEAEIRGKAQHFDDDGVVQLMDVSAPYVYNSTDEYRRSVVMVRIDDENSYVVDFFRVLGGDDHLYSFHAQSNEINSVSGLDLTPQTDENGKYIGSYAGKDVEYGKDPNSPASWTYDTVYPRGYTWLNNVDRDSNPQTKFEIDFAIKDFNKAIDNADGLGLHMTVLNKENVKNGADADVAIADGYPPQTSGNENIDRLKYVLIKNTGNDLDTTFTTVFEPYRDERVIASADELDMTVVGGNEAATAAHRAIKLSHANGREDYVFYSTDNRVTYSVVDGDRTLLFRGFVGVYSLNADGENIYSYVHDGDIIGEAVSGSSGIEGTVKSFSKTLEFENSIIITPDSAVSDEMLEDLANRYLFIDNGANVRSGTFKIESATRSGKDIKINTGRISPIRSFVDSLDEEKGFVYMIKEGQTARIPMSLSQDDSPVFDAMSDNISTSSGSSVSIKVNAESPLDLEVTYSGTTLPRGATLDETTGTVTWKPTSSQIGKNHFAITATDSDGRESTVHYYVTVYGSTTGGGAGAGGGTGAGGETATTPSGDKDNATNSSDSVGDDASIVSPSTNANVRFIDLGAHTWAAEAINSLADNGIIKGTTNNTYSPANNITRADFALLLVRAFKLESEDTENFDDVTTGDYFASELAIARNTGIVNGIGNNKYAPKNTITRQDMMVIVYRVLEKLDKKPSPMGEAGSLAVDEAFADYNSVSDYARDAVSSLILAELVNGKSGKIAPNDYTTRAEVAVLLKRILDYSAK